MTARVLAVCLALGGATACATHRAGPAAPVTAPREVSVEVLLHGRPLTLHLAKPAVASDPNVLVLYASGDGGWFGTAVDMFHEIARAGYATAGFSARAFLRIERPRGSALNPGRLALEYGRIIERAGEGLGLTPSFHVVLTGWSRGAALAVLASGEPPVAARTRGVIAIGLGDGEDLAVDAAADDDGAAEPGRTWPIQPYGRIAALGATRVAVIQASHDQYLSSARARALFGADTASRRFLTVEATNHRFSNGKVPFAAALRDALGWVSAAPGTPTPQEVQ